MKYVVYKDGTKEPKVLSANSFVWSGLTPGTHYTFYITVKLVKDEIEVPRPLLTIRESTKYYTGR